MLRYRCSLLTGLIGYYIKRDAGDEIIQPLELCCIFTIRDSKSASEIKAEQ